MVTSVVHAMDVVMASSNLIPRPFDTSKLSTVNVLMHQKGHDAFTYMC